ncbi:hypothetical protein BJY01DRAFT_242838 [Aspergillus pseudoustus]|uniref:Fungal-specific transcription factor domain-containing protein n=1 Tax=Aspergillus pseudoustus TaxID=1810923 RepID=A0ABR4KW47_9EURO
MAGLSRPSISDPSTELPLRTAGVRNLINQRDFMFVDFAGESSARGPFGKRERVFVHKRFHQKKKQASIDRLRSRFPDENKAKNSQDEAADADEKVKIKRNALIHLRQAYRDSGPLHIPVRPSQTHGDPFSTFAMPMTGKLWMYLQHYRVHIISCSYPFDASQMQVWWVQRAMASPAMLQTCAFRAAEHKALLGSNQGLSPDVIQKSIKDSIYFRLEAIKTLNELLRDPVSPATQSTVLLVSALVGNEAFGANFDVLPAHTKGLTTLVSMMGGLVALDHLMLSTIYQGAIMLAALQNTPPIFPMLAKFRDAIVHEGPIFRDEEEIEYPCDIPSTLSSLGTRFKSAPWHTELHPTMAALVESFRRLIRHFEIGSLFPAVVAPTDNDLFVIIQYEILSTHYTSDEHTYTDKLEPDPESKSDSQRRMRGHSPRPNLSEPLRQALLIYLYIRVSQFQDLPIIRCMVENFRQSLLAPHLEAFHALAPDLLFWLLFIGGMASRGYPSHTWFVGQLADVARGLGLVDWEGQVRPLLGEFFYTDRPGQTGAEDLWSEVILLTSAYRYIAPKPRMVVIEVDGRDRDVSVLEGFSTSLS